MTAGTPAAQRVITLGPMPVGSPMVTVDEQRVNAPAAGIFSVVRAVEQWPALLPHYRYVRFRERTADGGGIVVMSANRPFGPFGWPTWWVSEMSIDPMAPAVRFRHIDGVTKGMQVEWSFRALEGLESGSTQVRVVHAWDGPHWPVIGVAAATVIIGPIFIHGIASRTLAGLAQVAESESRRK